MLFRSDKFHAENDEPQPSEDDEAPIYYSKDIDSDNENENENESDDDW